MLMNKKKVDDFCLVLQCVISPEANLKGNEKANLKCKG